MIEVIWSDTIFNQEDIQVGENVYLHKYRELDIPVKKSCVSF